jgi:hypothetical protein
MIERCRIGVSLVVSNASRLEIEVSVIDANYRIKKRKPVLFILCPGGRISCRILRNEKGAAMN